MHETCAARKYCKKNAEVVLLFNPVPSQVKEVNIPEYESNDLLTEKCFPKAHPWPREYFWLILGFGGGWGSRNQHIAALSQLFAVWHWPVPRLSIIAIWQRPVILLVG